jgi:ATP adenylyltransferase
MKHLWTPWRMPYLQGGPARDEHCVFCQKAETNDFKKDHILKRGERCFVMLNLYPYNSGHMMVIPRQHVSALETLEPETLAEMMALTQQAIHVLKVAYRPQGFNIGINQGEAAGAGIAAHLHEHIVPRWNGDTNFMTVFAETRTIPEWIDTTYERLQAIWRELYGEQSS